MKTYMMLLTCLLLVSQVSGVSADVLDPDLVLYFDYEDFDGDTVVGKSGRGYDGAINGRSRSRTMGSSGKPRISSLAASSIWMARILIRTIFRQKG